MYKRQDYRRVALYGVDVLIEEKKSELEILDTNEVTESIIREREEIKEQIDALQALKVMAAKYGYDISKPASNAKEAVQWLYFEMCIRDRSCSTKCSVYIYSIWFYI